MFFASCSCAMLSPAILRLNTNSFTGTIRDGFNRWEDLDFADFRNNAFTGTIPATIFTIPTLRILYFSNNQLDGTIPSNYGNSTVLRDLFLDDNNLSGTVPDIQPGQLTDLTEFLLNGNSLTGTMAPSICQLRIEGVGVLDDLWADCSDTASPKIECDCCTLCFPTDQVLIEREDPDPN